MNGTAGPLKQPIPGKLMCGKCESWMKPRGGYLMGGWSDWIGFSCPACGHVWYWSPDRPGEPYVFGSWWKRPENT